MKWLKNILGGGAEAKTTSLRLDGLDAWLEERSSNIKFEESSLYRTTKLRYVLCKKRM